ncbi:MAG: hypothetical protein RLZZ290_598 [Pseudomonadota bacterium]
MKRSSPLRADLALIADWVAPQARVLDLGCGDGSLIHWLKTEKGCTVYGVEIDHDKLLTCISRGLSVVQADIDQGLALLGNATFDTIILSQVLQATHRTEQVLREIARMGREAIVSSPNFGHWSHVWSLLHGRMPVNRRLPYQWFDTPNLHFATTKDFEALLDRLALRITRCEYLREDESGGLSRVERLASLRATLAIYQFHAKSNEESQS